MLTTYDDINEMRAELRGCVLTKRERRELEARLAEAIRSISERADK